MASFDVEVWQTKETYDNHGTKALDVAEVYIQEAFDKMSHTVTVTKNYTYPDPPYECYDWNDPSACTGDTDCETVADPCNGYLVCYDSLVEWWKRERNCNLSGDPGDCALLISNADGPSGRASTDHATMQGAPDLVNLDPDNHTYWGYGDDHGAASVALHELGHCLMDGDGYAEHNVGMSLLRCLSCSTYYRTPFMPPSKNDTYWKGNNECGTDYDEPDSGYNALMYTTCAENKFEHI